MTTRRTRGGVTFVKSCETRFDDLNVTILTGHHQPLRAWVLCRALVLVADSSFPSLLFLHALRGRKITVVTRLRLEAALYEPAPPRTPGTDGRPRNVGKRLPTLVKVPALPATAWTALRVEQ